MDILNRCGIVYGAASLVIPAMALLIRQNGADVPSNPAWVLLIKPLFYALAASWILLIVGYFVRQFWLAMEASEKVRQREYEEQEAAKQAVKDKAERQRRWIEAKIEKLEKRNEQLFEKLKKAEGRLDELEKPEPEALAVADGDFEPEEGSISLALEEFG